MGERGVKRLLEPLERGLRGPPDNREARDGKARA